MLRAVTIPKNSGGECCMSLDQLHRHHLVKGRVRWLGGKTGCLPVRQGAANRVRLLPAILKALRDAGCGVQRPRDIEAA